MVSPIYWANGDLGSPFSCTGIPKILTLDQPHEMSCEYISTSNLWQAHSKGIGTRKWGNEEMERRHIAFYSANYWHFVAAVINEKVHVHPVFSEKQCRRQEGGGATGAVCPGPQTVLSIFHMYYSPVSIRYSVMLQCTRTSLSHPPCTRKWEVHLPAQSTRGIEVSWCDQSQLCDACYVLLWVRMLCGFGNTQHFPPSTC